MALDERSISTRTKLKESYLQAERQKAVMFATLNRVRQSLQDQGAQPQPDPGLKAAASIPGVPFLWMPHGSAGTTQQGLHGAKCLRTGSGSVGLQSVNKVHGLASPHHQGISNLTATHDEAKIRTHSSSAHGIGASMPASEDQRSEAARFRSQASQAPQPAHDSGTLPHPPVPSMVSEASEQQPAATGKQLPHPVAQHPRPRPYTHQQQAEGQHSQQTAAAANLYKPEEAHMSSPRQKAEKYLTGVRRAAGGGWEARVGRHGSSKARESLGIHATAFAAARAYDRALLTNPRPSEQHGNFNFPVQDYVAAESSDLSKAALAQLRVFHDAKQPSSKRPRLSPSQATHPCAPSQRNPSSISHAQLRHSRDPPCGHGNAGPPPPVKRSWNRQTVADPSLHQRPAQRAEKPGDAADWHQTPSMPPQSKSQSSGQLHKQAQVGTSVQQAESNANKAPAEAFNMTRGPGVASGSRDPDDEPSTSGNHRSWDSVLSGASLATSGRPAAQAPPPEAEPAANLEACGDSALETESAPTGAAADAAAPDDAARHHREQERGTMSSKQVPDTLQCREHPSLHPVVCHAHRRSRASTPQAAPATPAAPAGSTQPHADGPAAAHHANASLPGNPAQSISAANPHPDGHHAASASTAGPAAAEPPSTMLPSPKPETVRAGDSDDDVEIMDDSPMHKPASSASLSMRGAPSSTDDCTEQQARDRAPHWGLPEGNVPAWNQEQQLPQQLPDQQLQGKQQDSPTWQQQQQQQQQHGARYQERQQEHQQPQPGKTIQGPQQQSPQQQQQQPLQQQQQPPQQQQRPLQQQQQPLQQQQQPPQQQQQQRFQHFLRQQEEHLSRQHKTQQQPQQQQHTQAEQSHMPANLPGLSHLPQQARATAGGEWPPPPNAAAVKQEPVASQSHNSAHMPGGGCRAVAGSSLTHPLELSESDADSSASSSVDPSQRVPAPWLHADTAASRQPEARDSASVQCSVVPAGRANAQAAAHALLRQASQGSTLTNGHLRTKRGPPDKTEGPRSKLARVATAAVPSNRTAQESRRAGATAAEAVDLSDDDDDVVIIEENMQPEPQGPRGLRAPAASRQPGAPPVSRSGWHVKPRVPAAAAAARAALFGPSSSPKPSPISSLVIPTSADHTQHMASPQPSASQAGEGDLQASNVLSATLAALRQPAAGNAQAVATSAGAEESAASAAAAGVAELRRTEQQSNPEFRAAQETEWQQRQAEIGKQSEQAQLLKRQRKAEKEKKARQEAEVAKRLAEHRAEEGRKEAEEQEKDQIRLKIRERLARKLDKAKTLRQVLTAFGIPVDGGFTATSAQVDKAYKKAMILFHPDKHVNKGLEKQLEAEESFKIISHAKNRKTK